MSTTPAAIAAPLPAPTPIANMQALPDWLQPGNAGNDGGPDPTKPHGQFLMIPGAPALFVAHGAAAYDNGYWYRTLPGDWRAATYYKLTRRYRYLAQAHIDACQAVEGEAQHNPVGTALFNMAIQEDNRNTKQIRTFDYGKQAWVSTGIPVPVPQVGQQISIIGHFLRQGGLMTHLAVEVNGVSHALNITRPAFAQVAPAYLNVGFQLDVAAPATPFAVQVDEISLEVLATAA